MNAHIGTYIRDANFSSVVAKLAPHTHHSQTRGGSAEPPVASLTEDPQPSCFNGDELS